MRWKFGLLFYYETKYMDRLDKKSLTIDLFEHRTLGADLCLGIFIDLIYRSNHRSY